MANTTQTAVQDLEAAKKKAINALMLIPTIKEFSFSSFGNENEFTFYGIDRHGMGNACVTGVFDDFGMYLPMRAVDLPPFMRDGKKGNQRVNLYVSFE